MKLKLLSYNIRFGGERRQAQLAQVLGAVGADLVVFQEAIEPRVIRELAEAAEYPLWSAKPAHSIAFISRVPVAHHAWHYSPGAKHPFLEIVLADGATRIFGLHLSARFSRWSEQRRAREIRQLLSSIQLHQEGFHVLVGDFNTLAPGEALDARRMPNWIRALIWLSGRDIQRETIQIMLKANYVDGYRMLHPDDKGYTFPTWDPHLRLDYVFLPGPYAGRLIQTQVIREPAVVASASDHFPLLAQLEVNTGLGSGPLPRQ